MYFQYYKTNNGKRMVNFSTCLKFNYHYAIYYHFIITFADKKRKMDVMLIHAADSGGRSYIK